jgi:hypothetical protein
MGGKEVPSEHTRIIENMKETLESHTRKAVQMHTLAENFCRQLAKKVSEPKC